MESAICSCVIPVPLMSKTNCFQSISISEISISRNHRLRPVEMQECDYSNMENELVTLADRLVDAREKLGWKKADLRRAAGLKSASTLTELENGTITESPQLPKIAYALGVEVLWLQHGTGQRARRNLEEQNQPAALSSLALQLAYAVNDLPEQFQAALMQIVSMYKMKSKGDELVRLMKLSEEIQAAQQTQESTDPHLDK